MKNRFWIIVCFLGLILGVGIFLFFVWHSASKEEKVAESETTKTLLPAPSPRTTAGVQAPESLPENLPEASQKLTFEESESLEFKPFFEEEGEKFKEAFFKQLPVPTLPNFVPWFVSNEKEPSITTITTTSVASGASESTSTEIILSLTPDEFHFLYPESFIQSLIEAQSLFIVDYDPNYVPLTKIETDAQVRFVEEKLVNALLASEMITKEEADNFIHTIRVTLPELQLKELQIWKSSGSKTSFFNNIFLNNIFFPRSSTKKLFLAGLIEKLYSALIPEAQAACGHCNRNPICFRTGVSTPKPGFNVLKPFCHCTGCYHGHGCIDFCGAKSSLWDPVTGICGCG